MKNILFLSVLFLFSCNTSKLSLSNPEEKNVAYHNDTIFYKDQPAAKVEHFGIVIDKNNHPTQKIILRDISCCDDYSTEVLTYVRKNHHSAIIEYRSK